mmetsp:Transcript_5357/g.8445  ORF Transcript_5357/g.8445 Transcript_5357/m.8445 type:complete len:118 (+) Transcript_5357:612-965(+)
MGKNVVEMETYRDLLIIGRAASAELEEQAENETDLDKKKELRRLAREIRRGMIKLRKAQYVELTTPQPGEATGAGDRLRAAVKAAKKDLRKLERAVDSLKIAAKWLDRVTKLLRIVT